MKTKLIEIKGCKHCTEVLLHLGIDKDGSYYVKIVAWHQHKDGEWYIQEAEIDYNKTENPRLMHERFIADFSQVSANEFANSFSF